MCPAAGPRVQPGVTAERIDAFLRGKGLRKRRHAEFVPDLFLVSPESFPSGFAAVLLANQIREARRAG